MGHSPLDVLATVETEENIIARLEELELELAARYEIPKRQLRRELPRRIRAGEVDENSRTEEWLFLYSAAIEYATIQTGGPPRAAAPSNTEQGPHDAALAAFGSFNTIESTTLHGSLDAPNAV